MKVSYKAIMSVSVLMLSSIIFAADIGIIPDKVCPANLETITIHMDDEHTSNISKLTGWVGATESKTTFKFCRTNGDAFKPLSNGEDYAVLQLSESCPADSISFYRYFDNENTHNNNSFTGNIYPNSVGRNTRLKFCYFEGGDQGMDSFPDIGIAYGVFAPKNFSKSLASGTIYTDDENSNNANRLNIYGHNAIKSIIYAGRNTKLHVHKVKMQNNSIILLTSGEPEVHTVDKGKYKYYKIYAHAGDTVKVDLYDMDANANLYVRIGSQASVNVYDYKSDNGGESHDAIDESRSLTMNKKGDVYIAVHAPTYGCYNNVEHTIMASVSSGGGHEYGKAGKYEMRIKEDKNRDYTYYYPKNIANMAEKPPLIFMVPGGNENTAKGYTTLIKFMVSHGNAVLASKSSYGAYHIIDRLEKGIIDLAINDEVDTKKIGVFGHSTGGAHAFNVLKHFSDKGYGSNGRFIYSFDPFQLENMRKQELVNLANNYMNTNVIMFQSTVDGSGAGDTPLIPLRIYSLLASIPDEQKDYQVYEKDGHHYIEDKYISGKSFENRVANIQHVLEPLNALMAYTFDGVSSAKNIALGVGSDDPINDPISEKLKVDITLKFGGNHDCKPTEEGYFINSCDPQKW